jgi:hypothetical protein
MYVSYNILLIPILILQVDKYEYRGYAGVGKRETAAYIKEKRDSE